jgi:trk system potassium uptake protein
VTHYTRACYRASDVVDWSTVHVLIIGCGRVGAGLAVQLTEAGHTVAVVDKAQRAFRRLPSDFPGSTHVGLGFDRDTLIAAGVERASAVATVTSGDNTNILAARIAKETFEVPSVVARIYDPQRAAIYQKLGIATVATVAWTTDQIYRRVVGATSTNWTDQSGGLSMVTLEMPNGWAGRRLAGLSDDAKYRVVAVSRAGQARMVTAEMKGQEGDRLHCLLASEAADAFNHALTHPGEDD